MALTNCPECGNQVSEQALLCPHCGRVVSRGLTGFEYRSRATAFGLPLLHIASGRDLATGRPRVARGIVAIGDIAVGIVAVGGIAVGLVSLGGLSLGVAALGGAAVGSVALGGLAVGYYALGGAAFGAHALGGTGHDPQAVEFFKRYLGEWVETVGQSTGR
jgi:hypothetical protein